MRGWLSEGEGRLRELCCGRLCLNTATERFVLPRWEIGKHKFYEMTKD